jgi:hypothetical protein
VATLTHGRPDPHGGAAAWRAGVFGLDVRASFRVHGLDTAGGDEGGPTVGVRVVVEADLAASWPREGAVRVVDRRYDDGDAATTIDRHDDAGHLIFAAGYGTFRISAAADRIDCAPSAEGWERWLLGQLLPIAAVLNGLEVLHASAVAVDGRAVAFVAGTGVGKTSLALNMALRGHRLMTDDVVALSLRDGVPVLHPGPAVAKLRDAEATRMGERRAALGEVLGPDEGGVRLAVEREPRALPLGALYLLDRAGEGETAAFTRVEPGFRLLFASSFDFLVTSAERMRNQLEVFAALAAHVPVFEVSVPPAVGAEELARLVEDHVRSR